MGTAVGSAVGSASGLVSSRINNSSSRDCAGIVYARTKSRTNKSPLSRLLIERRVISTCSDSILVFKSSDMLSTITSPRNTDPGSSNILICNTSRHCPISARSSSSKPTYKTISAWATILMPHLRDPIQTTTTWRTTEAMRNSTRNISGGTAQFITTTHGMAMKTGRRWQIMYPAATCLAT